MDGMGGVWVNADALPGGYDVGRLVGKRQGQWRGGEVMGAADGGLIWCDSADERGKKGGLLGDIIRRLAVSRRCIAVSGYLGVRFLGGTSFPSVRRRLPKYQNAGLIQSERVVLVDALSLSGDPV